MQTKEKRLRRVQRLAHEIMDEMNRAKEPRPCETLNLVIDNLSRAVGDITDPSGNYSLRYLEEKVENAHSLLFQNSKRGRIHS
ncbi:hypothetical protein MHZ95_20370 [Sporosarcina sp. ACRSM]|uniref:hypothetical protein n=1 Tax=Sporosarcina sp. ACRSM TaxID=2918216 RepID=UPI001EF6370F|nr:hypothetical protein [Sporosarcina sp. ACRSM]MCG7337601.1 hypothetical protein [Sporosarcina sp. ACRSM]